MGGLFNYLRYSNLKERIKDISENYPGKEIFGITLLNGYEYLYTYKNDNVIENFIFNSSKIKKMNYSEILNNKNPSSVKPNKTASKFLSTFFKLFSLNKSIHLNLVKLNFLNKLISSVL